MTWLFRVTNSSLEPRWLSFPTSQVVEVELRRNGVIRYRWGYGRGFLFMVTGRELGPQSVWSCYVSDKLDVKPGRYTLRAWLNGSPNRPIVRREITIRS